MSGFPWPFSPRQFTPSVPWLSSSLPLLPARWVQQRELLQVQGQMHNGGEDEELAEEDYEEQALLIQEKVANGKH